MTSRLARQARGLAAVALLLAGPSYASDERTARQQRERLAGRALFETHCAVCHGQGARGDGPLADSLRFRPPDLTRLASRNGGRFDAKLVHRVIDGRAAVKGHGGPDMPVWGDAFKDSREGFSERVVRQRIERIVSYLRSIQKQGSRPER